MKQTIIAGLIAIASFAAFASPAAADTRPERDRRVEIVQTADLDLQQDAGAAALERRLRAAARRVCNRPSYPTELGHWRAYRACVRETLEEAVARIDAPLVQARFEGLARERSFITASIR
jgi:UrcA family protein